MRCDRCEEGREIHLALFDLLVHRIRGRPTERCRGPRCLKPAFGPSEQHPTTGAWKCMKSLGHSKRCQYLALSERTIEAAR